MQSFFNNNNEEEERQLKELTNTIFETVTKSLRIADDIKDSVWNTVHKLVKIASEQNKLLLQFPAILAYFVYNFLKNIDLDRINHINEKLDEIQLLIQRKNLQGLSFNTIKQMLQQELQERKLRRNRTNKGEKQQEEQKQSGKGEQQESEQKGEGSESEESQEQQGQELGEESQKGNEQGEEQESEEGNEGEQQEGEQLGIEEGEELGEEEGEQSENEQSGEEGENEGNQEEGEEAEQQSSGEGESQSGEEGQEGETEENQSGQEAESQSGEEQSGEEGEEGNAQEGQELGEESESEGSQSGEEGGEQEGEEGQGEEQGGSEESEGSEGGGQEGEGESEGEGQQGGEEGNQGQGSEQESEGEGQEIEEIYEELENDMEEETMILDELEESLQKSLSALSVGKGSGGGMLKEVNPRILELLERANRILALANQVDLEYASRGVKDQGGVMKGITTGNNLKHMFKSQLLLPDEIFLERYTNRALLQRAVENEGVGDFYFLIDKSGSMNSEMPNGYTAFENVSAVALASAMEAEKNNKKVFVQYFDYSSTEPLDVNNVFEIAQVEAGGGTDMMSALKKFMSYYNNYPGLKDVRQIFIMSDFETSYNKFTLEEFKNFVKNNNLVVTCIHVYDDDEVPDGMQYIIDEICDEYYKFNNYDASELFSVVYSKV